MVTNGWRKKLKELMMEFQSLRQRMMTEYKETVWQRYFTVTGEHPNEEVTEKIILSGMGGVFGEGDRGTRAGKGGRDDEGDTGPTRGGEGDREALARAAQRVFGHGSDGGGTRAGNG